MASEQQSGRFELWYQSCAGGIGIKDFSAAHKSIAKNEDKDGQLYWNIGAIGIVNDKSICRLLYIHDMETDLCKEH